MHLFRQDSTERKEEHKKVSIDWTRQAINWGTNGRVADASKMYTSKFWRKKDGPIEEHKNTIRRKFVKPWKKE